MPPSPPPVAHAGKKKTATAAATLSAAVEGTAASRSHAATNTHGGGTLQGKTFVEKIHAILAMPNYCSIISWNDAGTVVMIHDVDAFMSTIMPAHFKKSKLGSFIRRMRRWGFSVFTAKKSSSSKLSERGRITTVVEFSSEHFLRDQPDLCLLMKDERQVKKKKFTFLDRTVRKVVGGVKNNSADEGSSVGGCVHYPSSSSKSKIRAAKNQSSSSMMLKSTSTGHGDLNVDMNDGYDPHNYSQEHSMPSMVSSPNHLLHSFHSAMPMMSPHPPPLHYHPPYGYGAPFPPPSLGLDFGPTSPAPAFQYPAPDEYPPYQQQQQYYQMMQQNQQYPSPHTDPVNLTDVLSENEAANDTAASTTPNGCADVKASTTSASAALLSSSSEETTEMDLLPNAKPHPNVRVCSQFDTERNDGV
jgi:hypothetical protein